MIITKRLTGLVVVAVVLLTACGKKAPAYTKYIPKDASNVVSVDVKSLLLKLNSDSLTLENMTSVFKEGHGASDYAEMMNRYKDFKDAGLDLDSKVFLATSAFDFNKYNSSFSVQFVAGMKDSKKFEEFLKKQKETGEIRKGEGYSYTGTDEVAIGWNEDAVMIVYSSNAKKYNDYESDTAEMSRPKSADVAGGPAEKLKKYFKLEKKESILSVDGFNDLQGKTADVAIFNQVNLDGISGMAFAFLPKVKELVEGAYGTTTINFEDGKIEVESTSTTGKKMADILKKYAGPEVDMSLLENYPSQNVDGVMAFSFKPELIPALIKETGFDALLGIGLSQTGLSLDDFAKVFKGDFAVAVSDFAVEKKEIDMGKDAMGSYSREVPSAKMVFVAKIGDKAIFNKLVALGEKQGFIIRNGNMLIIANNGRPAEGSPIVISTANDLLTIASDSATLLAYQNKSQKIGLSDEAKGKIKGSAIAAFVDVEKILNGISSNVFDSTDVTLANVMAKSKATFKNFSFSTSNFSGSSVKGKGEIVFGDAKKNSLAQIVRYGMYVAEQYKLHEAEQAKKYQEDSTTDVIADSTAAPVESVK